MLPTPGFHHLHLNSVDPDRAIDFYTRQFPSTKKGSWGLFPALASPNDLLVLFTKVDAPPAMLPQSAIWHFGWHVTDARACLEAYRAWPEVELLPLFTSEEGGSVPISSDTWPGVGGVLGLTREQIAAARANGVKPLGGGGFAYMRGPDGALVEYAGDHPTERFNHVHLFEEDPLAALAWYRTHLNAPLRPGYAPTAAPDGSRRWSERTWPALDRQGMFRTPRAGVEFGAVSMMWYANQTEAPLVPSRGQLQDHIALSVADLDAWIAKLKGEGVVFLEEPYPLYDTRAVMIEGPSREALELVEIKQLPGTI
jgi:catechol 2,3-dioxygenase-like lactoylglutathione lyase family enzyme